MKRFSRWAFGGAVVGLAVGALVFHLVAASGVTAHSGRLIVHRGAVGPPAAEIRGNVLVRPHEPAERLATAASAPLVGTQGPVAAFSPDGRYLAYNTFAQTRPIDRVKSFAEQGIETGDPLGTPEIHVLSLGSRTETALGPGSQSLAWRADGALAYAVGSPAADRANVTYLTNVFVRSTPAGTPEAWTSDLARYTVLAWAGRTLIVQRDEPGAAPDLLALDAPDAVRVLARGSTFVAVSPDGAEVLVADSPAETPTPRLRRLRVSDGAELGVAFIADARDPATGEPATWIAGPGSWQGDDVVAAASTGLVVVRVGDGLSFEQVLRVDSATRPNASLFEPRFVDDDAHTIVAWSGVPGTDPIQAAQLICDRFALSCLRGHPEAPRDVPRLVYDLSGGKP